MEQADGSAQRPSDFYSLLSTRYSLLLLMPYPKFIRLAVAISCVLSSFSLSASTDPERPNILFIAIDDMNDWTGFLGGHPEAITPNMDRLAERGVNFTNAHCVAPGCSPSRKALLYGQEPFNSGYYAFYNGEEAHDILRAKYTSLPTFFKNNGYRTFGAGKIHHGTKGLPSEWTDFAQTDGNENLKIDADAGYAFGNGIKMSFAPTTNPYDEHPDYQVATYGMEVLAQDHDQPFFLAVGIVKPHLPFICPPEFFDLYPEEVAPPNILADDLADIPEVGQAMAKISDDKRFTADEAWTRVRRAYLACNSWADYNIGRVLDALAASPYVDNTIIVLWSDHGYGMGEKRHFRKFALWEETTRVPFILYDPRQQNAPMGRTVDDGVSLINIYPTLVDLAGFERPDGIDGFSLAPQLEDPSAPLAGPAVTSWGRGNYTVRTRDYRYTRYFDGGEELYAHVTDPNEWHNLADHPAHQGEKQKLAAKLPTTEAPLILEHITGVRAILSADEPTRKALDERLAK